MIEDSPLLPNPRARFPLSTTSPVMAAIARHAAMRARAGASRFYGSAVRLTCLRRKRNVAIAMSTDEEGVLQAGAYQQALLNAPETRVTVLSNGLRVATEQVCAILVVLI